MDVSMLPLVILIGGDAHLSIGCWNVYWKKPIELTFVYYFFSDLLHQESDRRKNL